MKKKEQKENRIITEEVDKKPSSKGKVISLGGGRYLADGTLIKPPVKIGDIVEYNPSLISHELQDEDYNVTLIINTHAIYGKYKSTSEK